MSSKRHHFQVQTSLVTKTSEEEEITKSNCSEPIPNLRYTKPEFLTEYSKTAINRVTWITNYRGSCKQRCIRMYTSNA